VPPVPLSVAVVPTQILAVGPASIAGSGFTVILTVSLFWHPLASVPVTVYTEVVPGVTVGLVQDEQDKPAPDHT
jgi:hypothetical protein